ncbi:hypothetical protein A1O7_08356 [Cladophialophora yegresii CBS 114405]|uniref:Uncharacterized protein n=1 Tax=Cladophialophora yegresii CBS 114405 TaxID=1182544 RepID=W9WA42_9EURO|nr:uncharacterized protein A1O7_08356 [Cladophialophora yegresii CBS 114405]EXJ55429.1 hypothetical protein A1O7_08356 [Cladophialophora yegresii CBS 114405]
MTPILDVDLLPGEAEWQRAYVLLGFVIHGHHHGYHKNIIPLARSEPCLKICDHSGVEPVLG